MNTLRDTLAGLGGDHRMRLNKLCTCACSETPGEDGLAALVNAVAMPAGDAPEWIAVPYCDAPYNLNVVGVQRLNAAVAAQLVSLMERAMRMDARLAAGLPIYLGHPDYFDRADKAQVNAWMQHQPPALGWIKELRAGESALELRVEWTPEGERLVNSRTYKFFSPFFRSAPAGRETLGGTDTQIYEPRLIQSAGLTNTPNWPMPPMVNAAIFSGGGTEEGSMNLLQRLIALLGDAAIKTEDDAVNAVSNIINAVKKITESVEARWKAEDAARQALPNAGDPLELIAGYIGNLEQTADAAAQTAALAETLNARLAETRTEFARNIVGAAVARGAVLQEHAESRVQDMVNAGDAFLDKAAEIGSLPPLMKTASAASDVPKRGREVADRRAKIMETVNAALPEFGNDYDRAFAHVRKTRPDLFGEEPAKQTP